MLSARYAATGEDPCCGLLQDGALTSSSRQVARLGSSRTPVWVFLPKDLSAEAFDGYAGADRARCNLSHSINRNQSRTARRRRTISSSASGLQWAIGPRRVFRFDITRSTALTLEKIDPHKSQLALMISLSSPKVV